MPSPSNVMHAPRCHLDAFSFQRHACPPTARPPASRLASRLPTAPPHSPHVFPQPLPTRQRLRDADLRPAIHRSAIHRSAIHRSGGHAHRRQLPPRRSRMHAHRRWRRAQHGATPTCRSTATLFKSSLSSASLPPRRSRRGAPTASLPPRRAHRGAPTAARPPRRYHRGAPTAARPSRRAHDLVCFTTRAPASGGPAPACA